jgi:D-sedoheptulose 7-phosphate isomerase
MLGTTLSAGDYLRRFGSELDRVSKDQILLLSEHLYQAYENGKFVFVCGNGGSGSNSSHICEDFGKSTLDPKDFNNDSRKRLKILSLTDNTPYILAWGNDEGFDRIFVEQLKNFASPGDLLISISGSGNSANVLKANSWAREHGLTTWGITGYTGGKLMHEAEHNLHVPLDDMGMVECIHLLVFHWILNDMFARINQVGRWSEETEAKTLPLRRAA